MHVLVGVGTSQSPLPTPLNSFIHQSRRGAGGTCGSLNEAASWNGPAHADQTEFVPLKKRYVRGGYHVPTYSGPIDRHEGVPSVKKKN
jgi:hypothetical protein